MYSKQEDSSSVSNTVNTTQILKPYLRNAKWFLLSLFIAICLAFLYLRYSYPEYASQAKIQILDTPGSGSELGAFQDLGILSGQGGTRVEDEIQTLGSRSNFIEVVKNLQLNIKMEVLGEILNSEMYNKKPFNLSFSAPDSIIHRSDFSFYIANSSETTFGFSETEDAPLKVYSYGSSIPSLIGNLVVTPNSESLRNLKDKKIKVTINSVASVSEFYQKKMSISTAEKSTNVLNLYLTDKVQNKAKDIINTLIQVYNRNGILDKKAIADNTTNFINDRISEIYSELSDVDQTAQDFKAGRGITDIGSESNLNLSIGSENKQELQNISTQLNIAESMKGIVDNSEGYELLPSNLGLSDGTISSTTARYNELALERKRLLKSSNEKNPIIVNLDQQLDGLKRNMQSSLNSVTNNLNLQVNSLSNQISKINSKIYSAPKNERALRDITRQQQTTESLYLYLLQKREESQITYASSTPKSKIIDASYNYGSGPVSPNSRNVYALSIILGLLIPFGIIYVNDLVDNKIHSKTSLEGLVSFIPVLAELPRLSKKESKTISKDDRSTLAESLRILRTNLDYLIRSKKDSGKNNVIFVTSSVPGEGKTFLSSNLAMILSGTNKKVLLIGADIRNPKLNYFFDKVKKDIDKLGSSTKKADLGLTEYLYDSTISVKDITSPLLVNDNIIDVIYSGKIPPNPAELLMSGKMKELIQEVGDNYDYVIVDTAPLMVVSDTLIISDMADQIIYVTRAGVTETSVIDFPIKLKEEGKLKNLSFVVNDVKESNLGYNGSYGYGYAKTMKKWWKF